MAIDKRFYDTIFAEVGGGDPEEVKAVTSTFLNLVDKKGYEPALKKSSAYSRKSKQYVKAETGDLNPYEKNMYVRNKQIIDTVIADPSQRQPFDHMENVNAFGEPSWAKSMVSSKDIGRQRFYVSDDN